MRGNIMILPSVLVVFLYYVCEKSCMYSWFFIELFRTYQRLIIYVMFILIFSILDSLYSKGVSFHLITLVSCFR
jgi:hypothetical protein